jgi:hypothetical protein
LSSYIKKENKILLTFYQNTFDEIQKLLINIVNKESLNIFAIDGTYSNTNILLMSNIFGILFINILFNYINYFEKYRSAIKIRVRKVNILYKYINN